MTSKKQEKKQVKEPRRRGIPEKIQQEKEERGCGWGAQKRA